MPTQTLLPDALLAHAGWAGTPVLATIDEDPNTGGGDWLDPATQSTDSTARVGFPTPLGNPSGVQTFKARLGLVDALGTSPSARIDLYEGGALKASGAAQTITATKLLAGQVISQTFDLATTPLTTANGSQVEIQVVVTSSGGKASNQRSASLDAVNWDTVNYSTVASGTGSPLLAVVTGSGAGTVASPISGSGSPLLGTLSGSGSGTAAAASGPVANSELLTNTSFEADALGATPAGWSDQSYLSVATTFAVVDTWAAQGTKSLRFAGGQSSAGLGYPILRAGGAGGITYFPAAPGETWTAGVTVNVAANAGRPVYVEIEFLDANYSRIVTASAKATALGVTTLSLAPVAPPGTAFVRYGLVQELYAGETWDWRVDACSLSSGSAYRDLILADNPVAYYRLGETSGTTAADAVGANPGTYFNGPAGGQPALIGGDSGTSVSFDGLDDTVSIPSSAAFDLTTGRTVEAWVRADVLTRKQMLVTRSSGAGPYHWGLGFLADARFIYWVYDGGAAGTELYAGAASGAVQHVVGTWDGATMRLYVDSVQVGSLATTMAPGTGAQAVTLGTEGGINFFDGLLDEVAIYNYALPAAKVLEHYEEGARGDLALSKPATASSIEGAGREADKANDGISTTRWASQATDNQWWQVDLGILRSLNQVKINWEGAYGATYRIEGSTDATTWATLYNGGASGAGLITHDFAAASVRYVKFVGLTRGTIYGYSFWDFEVRNAASGVSGSGSPLLGALTGSGAGTVATASGAGGTFVQDSCTDADGTLLTNHTPEFGGPWVSDGTTSPTINAGRITHGATSADYYLSGQAATDEFDVEAKVSRLGTPATDPNISLTFRRDTAALTYYFVRWSQSALAWQWYRRVGGAFTILGSSTAQPLDATNPSRTLKVVCRNALKEFFVDGVSIGSTTDNSITGFRRVGVRFYSAGTSTNGFALDDLLAADPATSDTTPPVTTLGTPTRTTMSRVPPYDFFDVAITANEAFVEYQLRRVPAETSTRTEGSLIEAAVVAATTSLTATITDDELIAAGGAEGPNWLKAFTKDSAGLWST